MAWAMVDDGEHWDWWGPGGMVEIIALMETMRGDGDHGEDGDREGWFGP